MMQDLLLIKNALQFPQEVVILSHRNPDGDAIGSCLAWKHYLLQKGHKVQVILPSEYPVNFAWMPHSEEITIYDLQPEKSKKIIESASMICCLDFNSLDRIDKMSETVKASTAFKIMIDHHIDPETFAQAMISDEHASATCELIFDTIQNLGEEHLINQTVAECLYTGILTDTGNFVHAVTPAVMRTAARLLELGVDNDKLQILIFKNMPEKQLRLLGYSLYHRMEILPEYKVGLIFLTKEDYAKFGISRGDTEGIVNYMLQLKDVDIAALITDQNGIIKFSFRSKGDISVQTLAREHFNGGGHKNASGGYQHTSLREAIDKFKYVIPKFVQSIQPSQTLN